MPAKYKTNNRVTLETEEVSQEALSYVQGLMLIPASAISGRVTEFVRLGREGRQRELGLLYHVEELRKPAHASAFRPTLVTLFSIFVAIAALVIAPAVSVLINDLPSKQNALNIAESELDSFVIELRPRGALFEPLSIPEDRKLNDLYSKVQSAREAQLNATLTQPVLRVGFGLLTLIGLFVCGIVRRSQREEAEAMDLQRATAAKFIRLFESGSRGERLQTSG
ncbi:hypothetical protein [Leifsonia sp. A12D58]|uniref:hypothetical protein n=1 Tax=Leifsonia sp. A12D58 TaxID=3397674 RepID=UPI0039E198AE